MCKGCRSSVIKLKLKYKRQQQPIEPTKRGRTCGNELRLLQVTLLIGRQSGASPRYARGIWKLRFPPLKTHPMFSVPTRSEDLQTQPPQGNHMVIVTSSFSKSLRFQNALSPHQNGVFKFKDGVFKFLRFEERQWKSCVFVSQDKCGL